ncbi:MAG: tetratricopeptide repeat-containing sensor histidine kinase [Cytophagales bacterium]|nr:tetratricopeptide repeat-containing sensor histidine kinase [Cytophagales bacterium]
MKFRYQLLAVMLLAYQWAWSQNQQKIDSLKMLAEETSVDTVRIDAFTFLMSEIMASDTLETTRLRDLAIDESEVIDYYIGLSDAYFYYGFMKMQLGQMDSARWHFEKSHEFSLPTNDISFIARALSQIGSTYYYESKYQEAINYYNASNDAAKERNAPNVFATNTSNIGNIYYSQGEYDSAIYYYKKASPILDSLGESDRLNFAISLQSLGNAYKSKNDFARALDYYFQSLQTSESIGDSVGVAILLGNIGGVYNYQDQTDLALEYFFREKKAKEQLGMRRSLANTYYNLGWVLITKKSFKEAETYMKQALETSKASNISEMIAYSHSGLGEIYLELGQYELTKSHLDSALSIREKLDLPNERSQTLNLLGMLASQQKEYQKALNYFDEGLAIGLELEVPELVRNISSNQAELYAELGEFQKAYEAHVRFKAMDDTIRNEDNTRKIALIESEYSFEKEKDQIEAANQQNIRTQEEKLKLQQYYTFASTGGLFLIIVIAFILYRNFQQKQKANQLLEVKNAEIIKQAVELEHKNDDLQELSYFKQGLTDMIAHDMKNPLNVVIGLSEGAPDANKMKQVNQSGKLMLQMVTNMLDVQKFDETEMKLNLAPHTLLDILVQAKFQVELLSIARSIQLDFQQVGKDIHLHCDREIIMRVLVNLFTNGIKYSDPGSNITVKATSINDRIQIEVADQGKGIHEEDLPFVFDKFWQSEAKKSGQIQSTGLGLTFCKIAVEAHDGNIQVNSSPGNGSTFYFDLAVGNAAVGTREKTSELSKSEVDAIQEVITEIRKIPLYQFADIETALTKITLQSESIEEWKEALRHAALNWDEDGFEKLLSQKEMSKP